jgi:hypothetical protein
MVDVAEWPKWLNDILTRLDDSSAEQGPSAVHGPARISTTLRKQLRDICIELHHTHLDRSKMRESLVGVDAALRRHVPHLPSNSIRGWAFAEDVRSMLTASGVRFPDAPTYGVWCVEDRAWCPVFNPFRGTREEAESEAVHWRSGDRADVAPGAFTYEVRPTQ